MSRLKGKTIVITRPQAQSQDIIQSLESRGANPYLFPVIETVRMEELSQLDLALHKLETYDWILFTSVNTVMFFFEYIEKIDNKEDIYAHIKQKKVAAIGPKTANALKSKGLNIPSLPTSFMQEGLVDYLKQQTRPRMKVLFPKAKFTREFLREQLQELGLVVDEIVIYKTVAVDKGKDSFLEKLKCGELDVITFTSSSTVRHFMAIFEDNNGGPSFREYVKHLVIACIGPVTAQTARDLNLPIHVEAEHYTVDGLIEALENYYKEDYFKKE